MVYLNIEIPSSYQVEYSEALRTLKESLDLENEVKKQEFEAGARFYESHISQIKSIESLILAYRSIKNFNEYQHKTSPGKMTNLYLNNLVNSYKFHLLDEEQLEKTREQILEGYFFLFNLKPNLGQKAIEECKKEVTNKDGKYTNFDLIKILSKRYERSLD